jgi:hypothetical protein
LSILLKFWISENEFERMNLLFCPQQVLKKEKI